MDKKLPNMVRDVIRLRKWAVLIYSGSISIIAIPVWLVCHINGVDDMGFHEVATLCLVYGMGAGVGISQYRDALNKVADKWQDG